MELVSSTPSSVPRIMSIIGTTASSQAHLPADGSARFHPSYNLDTEEIAWAYEVGTVSLAPYL